ncbi:MAG: hypothetical protein IJ770_00185 [Alphaproteobacteria bacterium]|nr:hypothetical protein [Alphaproteobacteria bacterium]
MDYKSFIQDELSKFRLILLERGISGEAWRKYMAIKLRLLKGQFDFEGNPKWQTFRKRVQPLVRMRGNKIVWHGTESEDFLAKVSIDDFNLATEPEKFVIITNRVTSSLMPCGKIKVCFPSDNAGIFRPSAVCVFQQLPDCTSFIGLLFEVHLESADVRQCYDEVLKCHIVTVQLYYYSYIKNILAQRSQMLPDTEEEELEVRKVREVNKVKKPEKPNKVIRMPQRSH